MNKFDTQIKKLLVERDKEQPIMTVDRKGTKKWCLKNGKLHREDGPAVEYKDGTKEWWLNDERHREGGPAWELIDGSKAWFKNGNLHREDGPAAVYSDGSKEWYLNGEYLSEDEWRIQMNIKNNVPPEHRQSVLDILDL